MSVQLLERVSLEREFPKERLTLDVDTLTGLLGSWKARGNSAYFWEWGLKGAFREFVAQRVDDADELSWCYSCDEPLVTSDDEVVTSEGDNTYCSGCADEATHCNDCGIIPNDSYSINDGDYDVCSTCYYRSYSYCDDCDVYHSDSEDHSHDGSGCCESPRTEFSIRNDGQPMLRNDTRVEITLPAGTIDNEGISRIAKYLRDGGFDLYYKDDADTRSVGLALLHAADIVRDMNPQWQMKTGNFTKRLSRELYKKHNMKLPNDVVSEIGNIARQHTGDVSTYNVETTRQLNMSAEDFAHSDSCWWQSYSESRCALKTNGGFGLRTFDGYGDVSGRAWVMPLKRDEHGALVPTFNTETPEAFVVFNGYGDLGGYTATRILAYMAGWTYRKIAFYCAPMYVNENNGYIVAPEDVAAAVADQGLSLSVYQHSNLDHRESLNG